MLLLSLFDSHPIMSFFLFIDGVIYDFIRYMYDIFVFLAGANIFGEADYSGIVRRIYLIIGVVMMFALAYSLLKSVINPDEFAKGENSFSNLIKNVVISLIIIALLPTVFRYAMEIQNSIIDNDVIGKIILPSGDKNSVKHAGNTIASTVYGAFLYPNGKEASEITTNDQFFTESSNFEEVRNSINSGESFRAYTSFSEAAGEGDLTYSMPFSTLAGLFVLWVVLLFCFDVAIRVVKLMFFQIIAPVPVICRILPNDKGKNVWNNWLKKIVSTYLEVFIRIIVMYLGVYFIILVKNNLGSLFNSDTSELTAFGQTTLAQVFIILGIVAFMRMAPKLIQDLFGLDSSGLDIGLKGLTNRLSDGGAFAIGGAVGAGITSATRNVAGAKGFRRFTSGIGGLASGTGKGLVKGTGAKSIADLKKGTADAVSSTTKLAEARADKRDERKKAIDEYMVKHGTSKFKATAAVAGQNILQSAKDYAGIDEIKDLLKDNEVINTLSSKKGAPKKSIEALLDGEMNKASSDIKHGEYSVNELRKRMLDIEDARRGTAYIPKLNEKGEEIRDENGNIVQEQLTVSAAMQRFQKYKKDFIDDLEKVAYNDSSYEGLQVDKPVSDDEKASNKLYVKLAEANAQAHEFKEEAARHLDKDYVQEAMFTADNVLEPNYTLEDETPFKKIGDILDLKLAENNKKIARVSEEKRKKEGK